MKFWVGKIYSNLLLLLFGGLLWAGIAFAANPLPAAELGFAKAEGEMVFTIPYEIVPEINALFVDSGAEVGLRLPAAGNRVQAQQHKLDDEWVTAFGIERSGDHLRWYLKKRDPALKVKSFLALERLDNGLKVVLLKPYRQWRGAGVNGENSALRKAVPTPAAGGEQGKLNRLNRLLEEPESSNAGKNPVPGAGDNSSPSLLKSAIRSFVVLIFLVLVILGLSLWLKRYRKSGGRLLGSSLVKVLSVENISGKHQVMLLDLLDEVLVVGVCGEQMTLLTTISEPERVEELRQLHGGLGSSVARRGFAGYLKGFMGNDSAAPAPERVPENLQSAAASYRGGVVAETGGESETLPDNYREVVSQIKNRLQKGERG